MFPGIRTRKEEAQNNEPRTIIFRMVKSRSAVDTMNISKVNTTSR